MLTLNYKVLPPKNPGEYYDDLQRLYTLLTICKEYWFPRDARKINDLLIFVDSKIFKLIVISEEKNMKILPEFTKEDLSKCFRKPSKYTGDIDWKALKIEALTIYEKIVKIDQ